MPSIEWILVAVLACLVALFLVLWIRARGAKTPSDSGGLPSDTEITLLAINQIDIAGVRQQYGVASARNDRAVPFLIAQSMGHLQVGDAFTMRNGQAYKVETRVASSESPVAMAQAQPAVTAQAEDVAQYEAEDAAQRTVVVLEDRNDQLPAVEQAFTFLEVVEGADKGMRFPLPYGYAGIGRSEDNVVALSDNGASRQHCCIEFSDTDFVLQDLNSTNGTFHNGEEITEPRPLEFGDRIVVSDSEMILSLIHI